MNKLVLLYVVVCFALAACGGAESRKEKYLQSGNEHYHDNDCKKAKLEYKNAIQIEPKTVEALIGLSRCSIEEQEWRNAYKLLLAALEADPNSAEAKIDLAKLHLISGDNSKAYELIEEALSVQPSNSSAVALRGIFHLKNKNIVPARTDSDQSLSLEPNNITAITLLSSLSVNTGETQKAVDYIAKQLSESDLSIRQRKELNLMSIALYSELGDTDSVTRIYRDLIELNPDIDSYRYNLANILAKEGKLDEAENILLSDAESNNDKLAYISFLDAYKSSDAATEKLQEYAKDGDGKLTLALGKRYLSQDKQELAITVLEELSNEVTKPEHLEAKNELALIALKSNDTAKAQKLSNEVLTEQPGNIRALILRGSIAVASRDAPAAIADFRTVLRDQPTNLFAIRQLAIAYVLNDQKDLAKELLQKAVEIDSNDKKISLLYARIQGTDQEFDAAINTVNELLKNEQQDLDTVKTLFDLQIANKDYENAKQTAESMKSIMSDNPLGYYLSGVLLQNENNPDGAEQQYLLALEKQPRANEPLAGLVRLYLSQEKHDKAIVFLQNNIKNDPEYIIPYNLLGEVALAKRNYILASDSFSSAIDINDQWWIPYRGLSLTYLAQGERDKAIDVLVQGYNRGAGVERLGIELANIYYNQGDRTKAIETYQNIIEKVPSSIISKNNLAMLLVDDEASDDEVQSALIYAEELQSIEQAASLDTAGWVNYKAGNMDKAIGLLTKAVALAPKSGELNYHLGMAYASSNGDLEKAKQHLKIAAESEQEYKGKEQAIETLKSLSN